MDNLIIAVDTGNKMIKSEYGIKYQSGFSIFDKEPLTENNLLRYNDKFYVIGEGRLPVKNDKTVDDKFFILSLKSIAMNLEKWNKTTGNIILSVGLPLAHFSELKEKYKEYFARKNVQFNYNGKDYKVDINEVHVWAQGYAGMITKFREFKGTALSLVDIGGYTTDICQTTNKGLIVSSSCISLPRGVIHLTNDIKQLFFRKGINLSEEQIEELILGRNNTIFIDKELEIEVNNMVDVFVENLLDKIKELGFELKVVPILFLGGGALLLRKAIEKQNTKLGYIDFLDEFSNVNGYSLLSKQAAKR